MGLRFARLGPRGRVAARRERFLMVGGTTLTVALLVFGILVLYNQNAAQARFDDAASAAQKDPVNFGTVVLLAPLEQIPKGTKLKPNLLKEMHWPRDQVPQGALRSVDEAIELFAIANLAENQPIVRTSLSANPPQVGISELLPPGHRAVTIEVDATSGVEGWATPGAHVDVYLTYLDPKESIQKTRIAVEDAVVLSYGGSTRQVTTAEVEKVPSATTVTLAVPFEDSLKIQTARAMGRITLALRNTMDMKSKGEAVFSASDWDRNDKPAAQPQPSKLKPGYVRFTDKDGDVKEFVLGDDERWWRSEDEDR